jgi:hypothetical protein
MMTNRTLGTDLILWIVFIVAAVIGVVLDRLVPQFMAAWGWVLILIALGAAVAALAWPLYGEKRARREPEPGSEMVEAASVAPDAPPVMEVEDATEAEPPVAEPTAVVVTDVPVQEGPQAPLSSEPESNADASPPS